MTSFRIVSTNDGPTGFRYLWLKNVTGFDSGQHCARCLAGQYDKAFNPRMRTNRWIAANAAPGDVLYFCGVSTPFRWENNAHLAVQATDSDEDRAAIPLYTGDTLEVAGARLIEFDGEAAASLFPAKAKSFLTCRNFQFGASWFGATQEG